MHIPNIAGVAVAAVVWGVVNIALPDPDFMVVKEFSYADGRVILDRAIRKPDTPANWTITIFEEESGKEVCHGAGRAEFTTSETTRKVFDLDWVMNVKPCPETFKPGEYAMYGAWLPLDGRAVVSAQYAFEVTE